MAGKSRRARCKDCGEDQPTVGEAQDERRKRKQQKGRRGKDRGHRLHRIGGGIVGPLRGDDDDIEPVQSLRARKAKHGEAQRSAARPGRLSIGKIRQLSQSLR
jgi:hypothetical protein